MRWPVFLLWACCALAAFDALACAPRITTIDAAPETAPEARPGSGWVPVTLPDQWPARWPSHGQGRDVAAVWYRIGWARACDTPPSGPWGLGVDGMTMAAAVYLDDTLLWRDAALQEPLSIGWNVPRWWPLPASLGRAEGGAFWIRVVGPRELASGLGAVRIGDAATVEALHAQRLWRQRTVHLIDTAMSGALGCIFLVVWSLRRREQAFGWYALMSLCWMLYLSTMLATRPWPWPFDTTLAMSRLNLALLAGYVLCFCLFTFRFGAQELPRIERALLGLVGLCVAALALVPRDVLQPTSLAVMLVMALVFFANCLQFQWHAWRRRADGPRNRQHQLLAVCWLLFLGLGVHQLLVVMHVLPTPGAWAPFSALVTTVSMALLLGGRLAAGMRRIERFNQALEARVEQARAELEQAMAREHAQALVNARLQERVQLAHDLHDGLGGSLVRGMALVEQARRANAPMPNERVLSLLKLLRDDLRQVIDHGSSTSATVPETPEVWLAPVRHRFIRILDAMGIASDWRIGRGWQHPPSALQCLGLLRILEEALSNVIKHSRARCVRVTCEPLADGALALQVEDDGVGFDVDAVAKEGLSVGTRSMAARAERIGAAFSISASEAGTTVRVSLPALGEARASQRTCSGSGFPR